MTAQPVETLARPAEFFAVYDKPNQEIVRVYESARDCQTFCDENNSWLMWDRYTVEPVPAAEWADDEVLWSQ